MTKKELISKHKALEKGRIEGWKHIRSICNSCIKAHREELKESRIKNLVEMNRHLWE